MIFLRPEFLYALSLLSIPIIIHLFNFRRYKVVYFSQLRFLKNIQQKTKTGSRIKHLMVLLSRCLAIAALVFAFAQPIIPSKNPSISSNNYISIYVDNSFSMQAENEEGILIDNVKNTALSIVESFGATDKFQLLTNEFQGKHLHWYNREDMINEISAIQLSPIVRQLSQVVDRAAQLPIEEENALRNFYLLSDLQKSSFDLSYLKIDESLNIIPMFHQSTVNFSISEAWFDNPYHLHGQLEQLNFRINSAPTSAEFEYFGSLYLNGQLKAPFSNTEDLQQNDETKVGFKNPASGEQQTGFLVVNDYPIRFDDTLFFSYPIQSNVDVLHIYDKSPSPAITGLFETDTFVNYQINQKNQIAYEDWDKLNMIMLDGIHELSSGLQQELSNFLEKGNSLVVFPSVEEDPKQLNEFLQELGIGYYSKVRENGQKVSSINLEASIFKDVFDKTPEQIDLPQSKRYRTINTPLKSNAEGILSFRNGENFLTAFELNNSAKVYLFASGLAEEESNLGKHALFVPLLYNMALQSNPIDDISYFFDTPTLFLNGIEQNEAAIHLLGNGIDFIPQQRFVNKQLQIQINDQLEKAGHYQLIRDNEVLATIALNYSRIESNLEQFSVKDIEETAQLNNLSVRIIDETVDKIKSAIEEVEKGVQLWKYFIVLALLFFGVETALLRLMP